ncbi:MAG: hypothetical protein FJ042_07090 [Candidatus Cloacimonetes bacterium]|nr:hypothetical protein [Candidatus Cloacimonadota bacterium]
MQQFRLNADFIDEAVGKCLVAGHCRIEPPDGDRPVQQGLFCQIDLAMPPSPISEMIS